MSKGGLPNSVAHVLGNSEPDSQRLTRDMNSNTDIHIHIEANNNIATNNNRNNSNTNSSNTSSSSNTNFIQEQKSKYAVLSFEQQCKLIVPFSVFGAASIGAFFFANLSFFDLF